jgi:hypothetical protein
VKALGKLTNNWRNEIVKVIAPMAERSKHISTSFEAALYGLKNDV